MAPRAETSKTELEVAIVSANPETLDGLKAYLGDAGVRARCTRDLATCAKLASATTLAFVIFPDAFRWEKVLATLADLAELRPAVLPVLVTSHPQRFQALTAPENVLVVPRPVWGWTILDAIRAHVDRADAKQAGEGKRARER